MVCSSLPIKTECPNGNKFIKVANPPLNKLIGINTPPNIPVKEMNIEFIGPVCFSFLQIHPISIPTQIYKIADGNKYIMLKRKLTSNGNLKIRAIKKNNTV